MLRSRGLLSKSIPKPSTQLQLLYGAAIVIFKPIQVEGLDVPSARMNDAFVGSHFQIMGEAKESIPERVLLMCSPVGDSTPDLLAVDGNSLALCKSPTVIIALTDLVQSASHSEMANRYDVDKALRSAVDKGVTSVAWVCAENIAVSFSPSVNLKGVTSCGGTT